jgi:hypothetical protein
MAGSSLETDAAAAALAQGTFRDQLDAGGIQRAHKLHQRIDVAADDAVASIR